MQAGIMEMELCPYCGSCSSGLESPDSVPGIGLSVSTEGALCTDSLFTVSADWTPVSHSDHVLPLPRGFILPWSGGSTSNNTPGYNAATSLVNNLQSINHLGRIYSCYYVMTRF
ncbi:hypothetical protein GDO81_019853 [Engystomops pustulosus]|uniref:Uncharacterized protein n=1 Tax=Engystomops pustulosus TaxID=76066 RepID=A0AAV6YSR4_ENGPU|nr:hypothetical protein GDO81_019853 [Engystomops pustulosus]